MKKLIRLSPFLIAVAILTFYKIHDDWWLAFRNAGIATFLTWFAILLSRKILLLDGPNGYIGKLSQYHAPSMIHPESLTLEVNKAKRSEPAIGSYSP